MAKKEVSNLFKHFYGIGNGGFTLLTSFEGYFFIAFMTDYAKLPLGVIAIILTITGVGDFIFGTLSGYIIYRFDFKWGKYRSWFLLSSVFVLLSFTFQFVSFSSIWLTAGLICIGFIVSHAFATIAQISNLSMMVTVTTDPILRGQLAGRRSQFTALFSIIFSVGAYPLLGLLGKIANSEMVGFTLMAGIISILFAVTFMTAYRTTKGYEHHENVKQAPISIFKMLGVVAQNPPLLMLMLSDLVRGVGGMTMMGFAFYYYTYSVKLPSLMVVHMTLSSIGGLIGATLVPYFDKVIHDVKKRYLILVGSSALLMFAASLFSMNPYIVITLYALSFVFNGASIATTALLYANTSVYCEWKTGNSYASVIMGLTEMPIKISIVLKGLLIAAILSLLNVVAGQETTVHANFVISKVFTFGPACTTTIAGLIVFFFYPLNKPKIDTYQKEIDDRKLASC